MMELDFATQKQEMKRVAGSPTTPLAASTRSRVTESW